MAYDTLVREAKALPEDMIEQIIDFMRFLKYTSKKETAHHSVNNNTAPHRSKNFPKKHRTSFTIMTPKSV